MLTKTICVINHNKKALPIFDYMDTRSFVALSLSGGVILWVYKGMAMLIPAARIINMANFMEALDKSNQGKTSAPKFAFTSDDALMLPKKIAAALLGE